MGKKHTENDGISQDCSKTAGDRTQCNFQTALQNLDQTENRYSVQITLQKQQLFNCKFKLPLRQNDLPKTLTRIMIQHKFCI